MATIVYLDIEDEITTAATRIRSTDAPRVGMVVPFGSRVATSRINFRLLAREAQDAGRRLDVVAPDASARALAASAGLPVFASVGEYEAALAEDEPPLAEVDEAPADDGPGPAPPPGLPLAAGAASGRCRPGLGFVPARRQPRATPPSDGALDHGAEPLRRRRGGTGRAPPEAASRAAAGARAGRWSSSS